MKRVMYSVLLSLATLLGATLPVLAADQQAKAPMSIRRRSCPSRNAAETPRTRAAR